LFTIGTSYLFAGSLNQNYKCGEKVPVLRLFSSEDTITTQPAVEIKNTNQDAGFIIPRQFEDNNIDFQVNTDIRYFSFRHFVKNESRNLFFQAWMKEKELKNLSSTTDSLRRVYANALSDQKDVIAAQILKNEARSIALNAEIPTLYDQARTMENQYWQSATAEKITGFKEKIKAYKDSISLKDKSHSEQTMKNKQAIPDTIIYYESKPTPAEIKTEESVGIVYKILIGSYKSKVPDSAAKLIKKLSVLRKVENYKDEKGVTIYTTGNLNKYDEAVILHNQVKQEGIKNASIVAYQNGKKITLVDAKKLNKE